MKFSFTKNPESDFFIKNLKTNSGGWEGRGWGVARVIDFFFLLFFFSKESKPEFFFGRGEDKGGLASVSEFVLQRMQI